MYSAGVPVFQGYHITVTDSFSPVKWYPEGTISPVIWYQGSLGTRLSLPRSESLVPRPVPGGIPDLRGYQITVTADYSCTVHFVATTNVEHKSCSGPLPLPHGHLRRPSTMQASTHLVSSSRKVAR